LEKRKEAEDFDLLYPKLPFSPEVASVMVFVLLGRSYGQSIQSHPTIRDRVEPNMVLYCTPLSWIKPLTAPDSHTISLAELEKGKFQIRIYCMMFWEYAPPTWAL